jgi:nicotinate-nucleotide pyrophosphorylase (carboxylating)
MGMGEGCNCEKRESSRKTKKELLNVGFHMNAFVLDEEIRDLVSRALAEDIGAGDVTTQSVIPEGRMGNAVILSRGSYVTAGLPVGEEVFRQVDATLRCRRLVDDGQAVRTDAVLMEVEGAVRSILTAERVALNFMQRMTGIASRTREFVDKVARYGVKILDTRKTTPTLRRLEKYAVVCGGGANHRMGLFDMVLIKDNHRRFWTEAGIRDLRGAVEAARARFPGVSVEVEVESEAELVDAIRGKPEWIMLDNMEPAMMRRCVELCGKRCKLEASGGVTLATVEAMAATGVDAISIGGLTHSAPAADLSLELIDE